MVGPGSRGWGKTGWGSGGGGEGDYEDGGGGGEIGGKYSKKRAPQSALFI